LSFFSADVPAEVPDPKNDNIRTTDGPLFLDLSTIKSATDNFSEENKLGGGGFGPVYKVML
jgi:hypothetical protein